MPLITSDLDRHLVTEYQWLSLSGDAMINLKISQLNNEFEDIFE